MTLSSICVAIAALIAALLAAFGYGRQVTKHKNRVKELEDEADTLDRINEAEQFSDVDTATKYLRDRKTGRFVSRPK